MRPLCITMLRRTVTVFAQRMMRSSSPLARSPLTCFGLVWLFARLPAVRSVALARAAGDRGGQQDGHGQACKAASFAVFLAMRSHNKVQLPQLSAYLRY